VRLLLIVNSAASSVTARRRVVIHKALSADHDVTLAETSRRGHATRLALSAARAGVDVVVVLGGDGTLNEAANGLAGTDTALATLPGGSTNVFARILGLPDDPIDAAGVLLEALAQRSVHRIGLGVVEGRYFLFHCGVGFDAAVVERVERRGTWKRWAGHPLFVWTTIDTWARHVDRRHPPLSVLGPGGTGWTTGFFTVVMNANPYTYLGSRPLDLVPEASLDRPLAAVTLRKLSLGGLLPTVASALARGGVRAGRHVDVRVDVEELEIRADPPAPYQVDGDHLGAASVLRFRWEPEALALVVP
jgi:diacylglycerol kinase family enzyme